MNTVVGPLLVALATTGALGLFLGLGWPGYVVGAVLALALWVMLFAGSFATAGPAPGGVEVLAYAVAAVVGTALGLALFHLTGGDNAAFVAPGFIVAGVLGPFARRGASDVRG